MSISLIRYSLNSVLQFLLFLHDTILLKLLHQNGIVLAKQIFYTIIIIAWHKTLFKPSILNYHIKTT